MRILQISDLHGNFTAAERASVKAEEIRVDLILVVGDITHFGDAGIAEKILGKISKSGVPILFVSGNCDPPSLLGWQPEGINAENIHGRVVEMDDVRFFGVGGSVGRFGTPTELTEEEIERVLKLFDESGEDLVLVTHTPPYGLEVDFTGSKHIGSKVIRRFVEVVQPFLVSCGHVHEGRAISKLGRSVVVNAGPARNGYCAVIDIGDEIKVTLSTLY